VLDQAVHAPVVHRLGRASYKDVNRVRLPAGVLDKHYDSVIDLFIAEWTGEDPARPHKPHDASSNLASAT
jgi:hypothetical protein